MITHKYDAMVPRCLTRYNQIMDIHLGILHYQFKTKPLLVGGKAKEYYGIRKAGNDTDLIITEIDYNGLATLFPNNIKDVWGDVGVCVFGFEIWKTICLFNYDYLSQGAIEKPEYLIISLEKLLFMTALAADKKPKYKQDLDLIVKKIFEEQYKNFDDSKYRAFDKNQ